MIVSRLIRKAAGVAVALAVLSAGVAPTWAEPTLEKIARTGTLVGNLTAVSGGC